MQVTIENRLPAVDSGVGARLALRLSARPSGCARLGPPRSVGTSPLAMGAAWPGGVGNRSPPLLSRTPVRSGGGDGRTGRAHPTGAPAVRKVPDQVRRTVFGRDPLAYHQARLPYPERVFQVLVDRCGLRAGTATFEVGPGTGIATRELLRRGAFPLALIEPDHRLVRFLRSTLGPLAKGVSFFPRPFEEVVLPPRSFDLGVAATSFHWLPERRALQKVARSLRPGGWWAAWANEHGDPFRPSAFHDALQPLYRELHGAKTPRPGREAAEALRRARSRALRSVGSFRRIAREDIHWSVRLPTSRVQALWGSFSDILTLPVRQRNWFLTELGRVVDEQFSGTALIPMLTTLYTAQRC